MEPLQFNALCKFIQGNEFRVVIVEGPRGVGKTTFCNNILQRSNLSFYKTWGVEQKWLRHDMQRKYDLDLPQATYFVLDFVAQVPLAKQVLADRGNLSAVVYQREFPYGTNSDLRKYYVDLMRRTHSVLLYLEGPDEVLLSRRISRLDEDEEKLYTLPRDSARSRVRSDIEGYDEGLEKMIAAGLHEAASFELDDCCSCVAFVATGTQLKPTGGDDDADEET